MSFLRWMIANVAGLAVAAWFFDDIWFEGGDWQEKVVPLVIVAAILSVIDIFVAPVVKILSIPFIIVTVGLFLLVINALMLLLTDWIAGVFDVGFGVDGFWTAVGGSIVLSIVGWFVNIVVAED